MGTAELFQHKMEKPRLAFFKKTNPWASTVYMLLMAHLTSQKDFMKGTGNANPKFRLLIICKKLQRHPLICLNEIK
jgi:hypothetical protein